MKEEIIADHQSVELQRLAPGSYRIEVLDGCSASYLADGAGELNVEAVVGRDAHLEIIDVQDRGGSRRCHISLEQQAGSRVMLGVYALLFEEGDYRLETRHCGEHGDLQIAGCAVGRDSRRLRFSSKVTHAVADCHTDEIFKMVGDDEFRGSFDGLILVEEGAVGTEAYQASRNLLTGPKARIDARPELEIYCDDVKCSHGCAVGQPDPWQMFYMQTRGIPAAEARRLLRQAFLEETLPLVRDAQLRERIQSALADNF